MARTKEKGVNSTGSSNNNINSDKISNDLNENCSKNTINNNNNSHNSLKEMNESMSQMSNNSNNCENVCNKSDSESNSMPTKTTTTQSTEKLVANTSHNKKLKVYFIELKTNSSNERQPKTMQMAFTSMKRFKFQPNWVKDEEVLAIDDVNDFVFIINSFDGKVFDHLVAKKARIIGPLTVLYCYSSQCSNKYKSIPEKPIPLFSQCMRKLFISISGFDGLRKTELITRIDRMCGNFCKDFTRKVTHLVTDSVRTKKYKVAKTHNTVVVNSSWVDSCWTEDQHNLCLASDPKIIAKHELKMFSNLIITVSQVEVEERRQVMQIVKTNGGDYSPSLKLSNIPNTLLLLKEPNGEKFRYAQIKGISCLDIKWLYDSVEKGFALPEEDYAIVSNCSQRSNTSQRTTQYISNANELISKPINQINKISSSSSKSSQLIETPNSSMDTNAITADISSKEIIKIIENLLKIRKDETFLEGCDVFVFGFERPVFEAIRGALILCGSVVFNDFKKIVTHVIVGPNFNDSEMDQLFDNKLCKFVTIEWLFQCLRQSECCDCGKYEIKNPKTEENSSGSTGKSNKSQDIFEGPLNVVCQESAQKALENWNKNSRIDSSHNHQKLGDRMNDKVVIEWNDEDVDGIPSQRPYMSNESVDQNNSIESKEEENSNDESTEIMDQSTKKLDNDVDSEPDVEVIDDNSGENDLKSIGSKTSSEKSNKKVLKGFMFSGYDEHTKNEFSNIVQKLNGLVLDSNFVLDSVTHLVIRDPSATEKTLAAIASGIWVLKEDYLWKSKEKRMFVKEEEFEWGYELANDSVGVKDSVRKRLMVSAISWRKYLTENNKKKKLFDDWNVLVLFETKFTASYTRVMRSGNASVDVLGEDFDERQLKLYKFAFVDYNSIKEMPKFVNKFFKLLVKQQKLLKIDFVSHYILNGPQHDLTHITSKLLLKPSVLSLFESQESRKRVRDDSDDSDTNASKHKK